MELVEGKTKITLAVVMDVEVLAEFATDEEVRAFVERNPIKVHRALEEGLTINGEPTVGWIDDNREAILGDIEVHDFWTEGR